MTEESTLAVTLGELRARFGDEAVVAELALQLPDPGAVVAALTGDEIWGVRYQVCLSYKHRRELVRVLRNLRGVDGATRGQLTWELRWPCRLVVYVRDSRLGVTQLYTALDAVHAPQPVAWVPPRRRR